MRFKSIQSSVALMAGASILAVVVALVLYTLFAGARTQTQVQERTQSLLEDVIDQRLSALAQAQVGQLQRQFEHPMTVAKALATLNSQMASTDASSGISLTREELSRLVGDYLKANPELLDLYIGWEPNAFDQNDDLYVNQQDGRTFLYGVGSDRRAQGGQRMIAQRGSDPAHHQPVGPCQQSGPVIARRINCGEGGMGAVIGHAGGTVHRARLQEIEPHPARRRDHVECVDHGAAHPSIVWATSAAVGGRLTRSWKRFENARVSSLRSQ